MRLWVNAGALGIPTSDYFRSSPVHLWIYHQGVPLGSVDLLPGELAIGEFDAAPGYDGVRSLVREASTGLWAMGFFHPDGPLHASVPAETFARAAALPFELRDADQKLVPADFVNIVERPRGERPVVFARFRHAHGGVAGELPPRRNNLGEVSDGDA